MDVCISCIAILGFILALAFIFCSRKSPGKNSNSSNGVEKFEFGRDFYIYNYLNYPVSVKIGSSAKNLPDIPGKGKIGLSTSYVNEYFQGGQTLNIFVKLPKDGGLLHYSDYYLNLEKNTTIKALHIGMITSRWVGAGYDDKFIPANAQQGRPWVKIHNKTNLSLEINNNINIEPYNSLRYTGRHHFGVALGTIFNDKNNIFQTFKFDTPATDIYYGVVSDIQQPLFGGWQLTDEFDDDPTEPYHLMEEGFVGGPAEDSIPIDYIPLYGPPTKPVDRWGEIV